MKNERKRLHFPKVYWMSEVFIKVLEWKWKYTDIVADWISSRQALKWLRACPFEWVFESAQLTGHKTPTCFLSQICPSLPASTAFWWLSTTAQLYRCHWQWERDDSATAQQLGHLPPVQVHPTREEIQGVRHKVICRVFCLLLSRCRICFLHSQTSGTSPKWKRNERKRITLKDWWSSSDSFVWKLIKRTQILNPCEFEFWWWKLPHDTHISGWRSARY